MIGYAYAMIFTIDTILYYLYNLSIIYLNRRCGSMLDMDMIVAEKRKILEEIACIDSMRKGSINKWEWTFQIGIRHAPLSPGQIDFPRGNQAADHTQQYKGVAL